MSVQETIEHKLAQGLAAKHIEVVNESHKHNVPPGSESHFRVVVVADDFQGKTLLARHRLVYALLGEEMKSPIHALALHTYTAKDWAARATNALESPPCHGGEKAGARP